MTHLIRRIWDTLGKSGSGMPPGIDDAVELVVENSCPKIRQLYGYKKQLRAPVAAALGRISEVVAAVPGPVDATSEATLYDNVIRPFFLNAQQLAQVVAEDPALKTFLVQGGDDVFYVLLSMSRELRTVYGTRTQGEMVYRDVALKTVDFSDHGFGVAADTEAELVRSVQKGLLRMLAHWALEKILEERSRMEELGKLAQEVSAKMKIMTMERKQMVMEWHADANHKAYLEGQKLLDDIESELSALKARSSRITNYLDDVIGIMSNADQLLTARPMKMHFGESGLLIDGIPDGQAVAAQVLNVKIGDAFSRSCVVLKCSRSILSKVSHSRSA